MSVFHPVVEAEKLEENKGQPFTIEGQRIVIVRHAGKIYALDDRCPHADASIALGPVENGCIVCPWHYAEFSLETGDALSGPATETIPTHQVRENEGMIEICLAEEQSS